jgi:hypothetical protein
MNPGKTAGLYPQWDGKKRPARETSLFDCVKSGHEEAEGWDEQLRIICYDKN